MEKSAAYSKLCCSIFAGTPPSKSTAQDIEAKRLLAVQSIASRLSCLAAPQTAVDQNVKQLTWLLKPASL
jgi:hypothetical protein